MGAHPQYLHAQDRKREIKSTKKGTENSLPPGFAALCKVILNLTKRVFYSFSVFSFLSYIRKSGVRGNGGAGVWSARFADFAGFRRPRA